MSASSQKKHKRRKPMGTVIPLVPDEITTLALITPDDIERAKASVTPELSALLDATPVRRSNAQPKRPA